MKAKEKGSEARHDAAADKRDPDYAVAKEKFDAMSGDAKGTCVNKQRSTTANKPPGTSFPSIGCLTQRYSK